MRRIGPELKVPDLKGVKPPDFLADVYYDLRDRRLLPLLALVVVAIAAVPFLLGEDVDQPLPPVATQGNGETAEAAGSSTLAVVEATPGLRDPKKRLKGRTPTDPFIQRFQGLPEGARLEVTETTSSTAGGGEVSAPSGGSLEVEVEDGGGGGGGGATPSPGSGRPTSPDDDGLNFYAFRPDIRFGAAGSGDLTRYTKLDLGQLLPEKTPVIAFMGVSEDGKRVAFDVSREVAQVRGPGRCIGGPQNCGLLILKAGQALDLLTGRPNRDFRLAVDKIRFVEVERPNPEDAGSSSATT
jgi:hypothetical protein